MIKTKPHTLRVFDKKLLKIERAQGIYLFSKNKKILDTTAGGTSFAVLGWSEKKIINSILAQYKKFCHVSYKFWEDGNIEKLSKILLSKNEHKLDTVYYSGNSGGEACEAAMKLSFLTHLAKGKKNKKWFIGRNQSYHGINTDALSIAERPGMEIYRPMFSKFRTRVSQHHFKHEKKKGENQEQYARRSAKELEQKILKIGPENVCAFIGETIMGGLVGDVEPTKNYWRYIRKVCNKYDIHLILDECYCGLGASGKIYCCDWDKITPDFIFVAKTLAAGYAPLSAVITKSEYGSTIKEKFGSIPHGTTYQGHSASVAAALSAQKIIHNQSLLNNVNKMGNFMMSTIKSELNNHEFYYDVRGRGLRFSFEYKCKNQNGFGEKLTELMLNKHNIFISGKWHRVCFTPAYVINMKQCEFVLDSFIKEFKLLASKWL